MNIKQISLSIVAATALSTSFAQTKVAIPSTEVFNFDEVTYSPKQTTFKLFAPYGGTAFPKVQLNLYKDANSPKPYKTIKMPYPKNATGEVWSATVKGDLKGCFYAFRVNNLRKKYLEETPGVFAKAVSINGKRGAIIDLKDTNPEGWENDKRPIVKSPADLVIYEMHHRDFSIDASSGLRYKGKFLALTEPKAIKHLKELGVNAIHILPSYDFGSIDETRLQDNKYNWGYDPVNYNVPEGSYSTNPSDPTCRIKEFKQMVQALHNAGIGVILDVVYNHTYDIEHSNFQKTYPDYYYRKTNKGEYSNGSGCGNETASNQPMMRRFMVESVKYWINEYHIDGFRFDLMGVHDIETMNIIREEVNKIDPTIFIYGEGWSAGECAYPQEKLAVKANTKQLNGIAAFSDDMRDALRGPFSDDTKGAFLASITGEEESLKFGIVGAIDHPQVDMKKVNYSKASWANEPTQQISYVSCHDDMCLVDRLKTELPGISTDELIRLDLLAQTAVFTSQGVPFMLSGEEMLRDKKGVHNSFESPDDVNHLDWNNLNRYPHVFQYYKNLIQLRKNHPAFRLGKAELVRKHLQFLLSEPCLVGFMLKNHAGGDAWKDIIVIFNGNHEEKKVNIPDGKYTIVCQDRKIEERGLGEMVGGEIIVHPQSALIIHD